MKRMEKMEKIEGVEEMEGIERMETDSVNMCGAYCYMVFALDRSVFCTVRGVFICTS